MANRLLEFWHVIAPTCPRSPIDFRSRLALFRARWYDWRAMLTTRINKQRQLHKKSGTRVLLLPISVVAGITAYQLLPGVLSVNLMMGYSVAEFLIALGPLWVFALVIITCGRRWSSYAFEIAICGTVFILFLFNFTSRHAQDRAYLAFGEAVSKQSENHTM